MLPAFEPGRPGILFFTRGRGRGHAIPDIAIARELWRLRPELDLRFVSYATGARTFREHGLPVIDLELPEANPVLETVVLAGRLLEELRPALVVSHEEFMAAPAARIFHLPALFITDWFLDPDKFAMQTLRYADEVVFIDEPGIFAEPEYLEGRVRYVGPVLRPFGYTKADRGRARGELDLPESAVVVSVLPGSHREQATPVWDLVIPAFEALAAPAKFLVWVAGQDAPELALRAASDQRLRIVEHDWQMDRLMAASDVAITKVNRKTHLELAALGIPSVSISYGVNRPDELRVAAIESNVPVAAHGIDPPILARVLEEQIAAHDRVAPWPEEKCQGAMLTALRIAGAIR